MLLSLPTQTNIEYADYVVVGGGSSGCVVASRLAEGGAGRVFLLEEGPADRSPSIHLPAMVYKTATGPLLQRIEQERWDGCDGPKPTMVQARVLGGGSSINGMLYVRGVPSDYDDWAAQGAEGWSYADVLPYFLKAEDNDTLAGPAHASGGPLGVSSPEHVSPLTKLWLKSCQAAGLPLVMDFNGGDQYGCGLYQLTLRNGRRSSTARAYLRAGRASGNLHVAVHARATRILVENARAVGVEYLRGGVVRQVVARREVILCAGAIQSPRLLMISGVGPAGHLREHGIEVRHDLPGVGRNLQDHMDVYMVYGLRGDHGYDRYRKLQWKIWAGLEYALFGKGPVCSNLIEGGAFCKTDPSLFRPDIQFAFIAGSGVEEGVPSPDSGSGCTLNACQIRPRSRGWVELSGPDPLAPPRVMPNYLSDPFDLATMARGVRIGQDLMSRAPISDLIDTEILPGRQLRTDEDYKAYVMERAQGALHPTGTCRIGNDPMAVVDQDLRVHGIAALRVADASVMPTLPSGNTNAPAIMVGERAADILLRQCNDLANYHAG